MQPPLPIGTVLQSRYQLTQILGKGGFSRTYLADDLSRFNELCVLKEYIPNTSDEAIVEKSKELFQREAQVLYEIQHPQIPRFRAAFTAGKRLFVVQDYVEGKSYSELLEERLREGQVFSQVEVLEFLQQMLPVLEYIHSQGIIHRDISPDNIICRSRDRLPVLIDFGAVKQLATQTPSSNQKFRGTTVGKLGYSPREQLQTGQAYPNSDLYALAVTTVVLMTGRKPEDLLDERTLSWRWHQWVPRLSPWFALILNRMMSHRPNHRYSSAREVAYALRALTGLVQVQPLPISQPQPSSATPTKPVDTLSSWLASAIQSIRYDASTLGILLAGTLTIATLAPVSIVTTWLGNEFMKKPLPGTEASLENSSLGPRDRAPSPSAIANPTIRYQQLDLKANDRKPLQGTLKAGETLYYRFSTKPGQRLGISLKTPSIDLKLLGPNQEPMTDPTTQLLRWEGIFHSAQDYYIQLRPLPGVATSQYQLEITIADREHPL